MPVIADNDLFRITHLPGETGIAVIAFAGISAGLGGFAIEEFRKSLAGLSHDVFFVIEKTPKWYNGTFAQICAVLRGELDTRRFSRVVTLGNSMGGFGAIAFARHLPGCVLAIAFCPQSSVHPFLVPFETRWAALRNVIAVWEVPDGVVQLLPDLAYVVFVGDADTQDLQHVERLTRDGSHVTCIAVHGAGHEVSAVLKSRGVIIPVLNALIADGDIGAVRRLVEQVGGGG
jgi:pimeloyl-ACP methyl ester carboxylesterase